MGICYGLDVSQHKPLEALHDHRCYCNKSVVVQFQDPVLFGDSNNRFFEQRDRDWFKNVSENKGQLLCRALRQMGLMLMLGWVGGEWKRSV